MANTTRTPNFRRLATNLDVEPVLKQLAQRGELWDLITIRQDFPSSPHRMTRTIYLRGPEKFTFHDYQEELISLDYWTLEELAPSVVPLMREVLVDILDCKEVGRAMIVGLNAHGTVDPHIDEGKYADHFQRYHICLRGGPKSTLTVGGKTASMKPGELWWFNHKMEHSAHNGEDFERIHIIFDAIPGD